MFAAILFQNGIRSRAFVPTAPAVRCSKSVAGDARETVASWLGGEPSPSNSYPDSYPLTTATPECIHLHLLDATKESKVCSGTSASVSRKCGVLVLGERDGLATLPEWETTYFDTGINAMRLRCLRLKGWEVRAKQHGEAAGWPTVVSQQLAGFLSLLSTAGPVSPGTLIDAFLPDPSRARTDPELTRRS